MNQRVNDETVEAENDEMIAVGEAVVSGDAALVASTPIVSVIDS